MENRAVPFTVRSHGRWVIVQIETRTLALEELASFGAQLQGVVSQCSDKGIILDLSGVELLSSVVISRIFRARKELLDSGGTLRIVASSVTVLKVFRTVQLDRLVGIYPTVEDAQA